MATARSGTAAVINCCRLLLPALLLAGCAGTPQTEALLDSGGPATRSTLTNVPFFPQEDYQCGPAALATVLSASNRDITPDELVPMVYVPGKQGAYQVELLAASRSLGRIAYILDPSLEAVFSEIDDGRPVLVLQNLGLDILPQWHFAVIKGYDLDTETVTLNSGRREDYRMSMRTFERTWARADRWAVVTLQPGDLPASSRADRYFQALVDFEHSFTDAGAILRAYRTGLQRWPDDRNLLMGYGNRLYNDGDLAASASAFRSVVESFPDYAPGYNNLAHVTFELGDHESALEYASLALEHGGREQSYLDTYRRIESRINH